METATVHQFVKTVSVAQDQIIALNVSHLITQQMVNVAAQLIIVNTVL